MNKDKEFISEDGPIKAKVIINKYGVELETSRYSGQSVNVVMTPELARLTIQSLEKYLNWI